jgi:hypothetical protein
MGLNLNAQAYSHELTNSKTVAILVIVATAVVVAPLGIGLWFIGAVGPFFQLFFGAVFIYLMYRILNVYNSIIGKRLGKPSKIWLNPNMIPLFACYILTIASIFTESDHAAKRSQVCSQYYNNYDYNRSYTYSYYTSQCYSMGPYSVFGTRAIFFTTAIYVGCMINVICLGASVISYIDNVASIGHDPFDPLAFEMNQTQATSSINVGQVRPEIPVHRPTFDRDIGASPPQYSEK